MNAKRLLPELLSLQARVDELVQLAKEDAKAGDDAAPKFMSQAEYARRAKKSVGTIRKWVKAGLPHRRRGKLVDIDVEKADAWDISRADLQAADRTAHGDRKS